MDHPDLKYTATSHSYVEQELRKLDTNNQANADRNKAPVTHITNNTGSALYKPNIKSIIFSRYFRESHI